MNGPLSSRGISECRGCRSLDLTSVLDLGSQPVANELPLTAASSDPEYPLHLRVCGSCGLGQVGEYVPPERLFAPEYPYESSTSTSWVSHAGHFVHDVHTRLGLTTDDLVVEIASNDGYLLAQMQELGPRVLGVEPAANVAATARSRGVPTIEQFFGREVAAGLVAEFGHPRLVVANNVMAHVPDLEDFVAGLAVLCGDKTVVTVENPSFSTLLSQTQFDTIYHEHFSYLTAHAVDRVVRPSGLRLIGVDRLATHGGSNRYWIARRGDVDGSVARVIDDELASGLLDPAAWHAFRASSLDVIDGLRAWLHHNKASSRVVVGYGAAAKGNTLLNAAGASTDDLAAVADGSTAKQRRYLPGSHVPVVAPAALASLSPEVVLVLPWNIVDEVAPLATRFAPGAEIWVAVPRMTRVGG